MTYIAEMDEEDKKWYDDHPEEKAWQLVKEHMYDTGVQFNVDEKQKLYEEKLDMILNQK